MKILVNTCKTFAAYLLLCAVTFLMLRGIVQYYPLRDNTGFMQFKQAYIHILPWKIAFFTHVFTIILALLAGFTQFSSFILKKHKKIHRLMGKIYAYDVFINFPFVMVMAVFANGLLPGKTAFVLVDCLWGWFTFKAVSEIKKGNIKTHKEFMIRSYALTLSAVMLRVWKIAISGFVHIDPLHLYMINAWLGFIPNLLLAEWLIRRQQAVLPGKPHVAHDKKKYTTQNQ